MATQAEIDALEERLESLKRARSRGVARVRSEGKEVEYETGADRERAIQATEAELAAAKGALRRKINFTDVPRQGGWR
jgi:hypothetical protein